MISRRDFGGLALGLASTAAMKMPVHAANKPDRDTFAAYARIRGVTPNVLGLWRYEGTIYGALENQTLRPLLGVQGCSFNRLEARSDGTLEQAITEAGYITSRDTGEILETWRNPLNDKVVMPHHYQLVQKITWSRDGLHFRDTRMQPVESWGHLGPLRTIGDMAFVSENFSNRYDVAGQALIATSMASFAAKHSDLVRTDAFVPATLAYQSFGGFVPWMDMGAVKGSTVWQLVGRKIHGIGELDTAYRTRVEKDYPGWLAAPPI